MYRLLQKLSQAELEELTKRTWDLVQFSMERHILLPTKKFVFLPIERYTAFFENER